MNGPVRYGVAFNVQETQIQRADYWVVQTSRLVRLWGVAKALTTGEVAEPGEHETIEF